MPNLPAVPHLNTINTPACMPEKPVTILMVEDDADDRMLMLKAFERNLYAGNFKCVDDGAALIDYLNRVGPYHCETEFPLPKVILLDLNMPKMDGREVLQHLKGNDHWRKIPVIVFTTSRRQDDIEISYQMGTNSYIAKPDSFEELIRIAGEIEHYWCRTVELPA